MVDVRIELTDVGVNIRCLGHAGYAERGKDIVCAAVSALSIALEIALRKSGAAEHCNFSENIDDGLYEISISGIKDGEYIKMCENFIYMFLSGIRFLQEHYPENICVSGVCTGSADRGTSQVLKLFERKEVKGWNLI